MKQTAVDFLIYHIRQDTFVHSKSTKEWNEVFQQSKEMEKEQHANTWDDSRVEDKGDNYIGKQKSFNDYYEQTYGGNK
jgi:hypothetical protein